MTKRTSGAPIAADICDDIAQQIRSYELAPGAKLPSERELSEEYNICRMTARRVYERLESEGLVTSSNRRGWFVAEARLQFAPTKSVSFLNSVAVRGRDARAQLLYAAKVSPPRIVRNQLKLKARDETYLLRRLLQIGARAAAIETMYVPVARFPGFLEQQLAGSILSLWREKYDVTVGHANTTLRGAYLSSEDAEILGVTEGAPAIVLTQTMTDPDGEPFAYDQQDWRFELAEFLISSDFEDGDEDNGSRRTSKAGARVRAGSPADEHPSRASAHAAKPAPQPR